MKLQTRILIASVFITTLLFSNDLSAASVDTVIIKSISMKKATKSVVIKPDVYQPNGKALPVLYLLHGYSGSYKDWIKRVPLIKELSDLYTIMIVCPDGGYGSWYFDSPVDSSSRYETYISKEVVNFIDNNYNTIKLRSGRAITGLSMGGHGAIYLAIRHQAIFGAAGSMSGGLDIRPFKQNWELPLRLGKYDLTPAYWENSSVINMVDSLKSGSIAFTIDCGNDDIFAQVNRQFHNKLLSLKIDHDYTERPGKHDWNYWANSIQFQMVFFRRYFYKY